MSQDSGGELSRGELSQGELSRGELLRGELLWWALSGYTKMGQVVRGRIVNEQVDVVPTPGPSILHIYVPTQSRHSKSQFGSFSSCCCYDNIYYQATANSYFTCLNG